MSAKSNDNLNKSIMKEYGKEPMRKEAEGNITKEQLIEKETEISVSAEAQKAAKPSSNEEQKFQIEKLRAHCMELFGVTASTFDGAFYGRTETKLTKQEAQAIINKWLGKE